jgi:hypothetical protein
LSTARGRTRPIRRIRTTRRVRSPAPSWLSALGRVGRSVGLRVGELQLGRAGMSISTSTAM